MKIRPLVGFFFLTKKPQLVCESAVYKVIVSVGIIVRIAREGLL